MKFRDAALASSIALILGIQAAAAKDPPLLSLTMEHFRDTATVKDNPIDGTTTISTENGFAEHKGLMRMVWNDEFLQAVIDQKTGRKTLQVDAWIIYSGGFRSYETVNYQAANGRRSAPALQLGKEVANCAVGDCTYTERIGFAVDEETLRQLAAGRAPGKADLWPYRFIAKSGPDFSGGLSSAEIAGFLAKVDEYARALPVVNANAASVSLKLDLGIGGMPVEATAEQPDRAGVLITAVNRGSVAHKSGIIVGDILHEFGGRPVKALTDLQAAVAACAANSSVSIKLFRGTNDMTVTARF